MKKTLFSISLITTMLLGPTVCFANDNSDSSQTEPIFSVTTINSETGEIKVLTPQITESITTSNEPDVISKSVTYEVFVPIEVPTSRGVTPGGNHYGGVDAEFKVDYDLKATADQNYIRINQISGGWNVDDIDMYYITDQRVRMVDALALFGHALEEYPPGRVFKYVTNWDYVKALGDGKGAYAVTSCVGHV